MNENNSKVIEYVLVILIALGVSYAVFAQASSYEARFKSIEDTVKVIQTKLDSLSVDNIINEINIKGLKQKAIDETAPAAETPAAETPEAPAPVLPAPTK